MTPDIVVNGILLGGFYAMSALGLSLVFGVLKLVNLAHGSLLMIGGYLAVVLINHAHLPWILAVMIICIASGALGFAVQRGMLTQLLIRGTNGPLVATFGLSLLAAGAASMIFGSNPVAVRNSLGTAGFRIAGVQVRTAYLVAFVLAALVSGALHGVLTRTRAGSMVRAAAADPTTAGLMGINVHRVYAAVFALAAALAAVGGALNATAFSVTPDSGTAFLLVAIAVVVLGGVGNVLGTFVGAVLLGLAQTAAAVFFGGGYRDLAVYLLFFVVLAVLPRGLFGWRAVR